MALIFILLYAPIVTLVVLSFNASKTRAKWGGLMAEMLNADMLMILTSVENVSINYGTPDEKPLEHITVADAKKYIAEGQFGENSMLPKMEAAVSFLEKGIGRTAVITSIDSALAGFQGKTGTIIE